MLSQQRLKEVLEYHPETGGWTWLVSRGGQRKGDRAGNVNKVLGYLQIRIDGLLYYGHRLAHLYMTGEWPDEMDHREVGFENKADCRWEKIRPASRSENQVNKPVQRNNKLGLKWVSKHTQNDCYGADVSFKGKRVRKSGFSCPASAHLWAVVEADKLHGEFLRSN